MRIHELLQEDNLDELDWRKAAATGALALGALGSMGQAHADDATTRRITVGPDGQATQSFAQQMAQQGAKPSDEKSNRVMPNQELDTVEKVERSADGIKIYHAGATYDAVEVPRESPVPRGATKVKVQQAQMGLRGIGNYTAYLLPTGKAYIYSK